MIWQKIYMDNLIRKLRLDYPSLSFISGLSACWSPHNNQVRYTNDKQYGAAGLLHELAHALLGHTQYLNDIDLLHKEVAAWEKARTLATRYDVTLDDNHIQDCLDTYRDWLHKRSTCPVCNANGVQQIHTGHYSCLNCMHRWIVSDSLLKRPYRRSSALQI
jgi:ribosomal protein L37AE/L43A